MLFSSSDVAVFVRRGAELVATENSLGDAAFAGVPIRREFFRPSFGNSQLIFLMFRDTAW
jgi:hypothetical protein